MGGGNVIESTSVIVAVLLILAACKVGQAVLEPVVFAIFIIEIAWPMQKTLRSKIGKAMALALTVVVTATLALALLSVIVWGGRQVAEWVGGNLDRIQESLISSTAWLEEHDIFVFALLSDHFDPATVVRMIHAMAIRANTIMAFAVIVLIYVVLGLGEADILTGRIATLKNQDASRRLIAAGRKIGVKFRTYMLVRTVASIATGLAVWGFAVLLHLEMAGAWGVLAFALNYLPYIGSLIVTAALPLFAFVQFGSFETPLLVLLGISFIQAVIGSYLEPVFSGSALSISPPLVLFSIVLWTFLWGALGAFLGVPLMIAALTLFEEFPSTRWIADILSGGRAAAGELEA
ncbi:AI-2E family transporter [Methylocystis sp. ATCC 49242]|uniref:AI-2E family transporter n=1 Tax=Methylocystis sp. ATCC 49242 TaxID=622637 RepID=UPI0001F87390|nr:AI-2E family transporter [Methylocystis sp. ATCC 49242]